MTTTRGPLPPGVYWRRRVFVLGLLAALVLLGVNVVRGGGGESDRPSAAVVAGTPSEVPTTEVTLGPAQTGKKGRKNRGQGTDLVPVAPTAPVLAEPSGPCADTDVLVQPEITGATAGQPVTVTLKLRTRDTPACDWRISYNHLALKITQRGEDVWTSRECPDQLPRTNVVVRRDVVSVLELTWNGRYSEPGCPPARESAPVPPGDYDVDAASLGSDPGRSAFTLAEVAPQVIEVPADPDRSGRQDRQGRSR